jgi:hypothetical protein
MPDLDLIKQAEQGLRGRCGRFARGRSGNPAGRPRGGRDDVNRTGRVLLAYSWLPAFAETRIWPSAGFADGLFRRSDE